MLWNRCNSLINAFQFDEHVWLLTSWALIMIWTNLSTIILSPIIFFSSRKTCISWYHISICELSSSRIDLIDDRSHENNKGKQTRTRTIKITLAAKCFATELLVKNAKARSLWHFRYKIINVCFLFSLSVCLSRENSLWNMKNNCVSIRSPQFTMMQCMTNLYHSWIWNETQNYSRKKFFFFIFPFLLILRCCHHLFS